MNIFLVTRKNYDIQWGKYGKEFINMEEMAIKCGPFIDDNEVKIITSIFSDDIEPAKVLKKLLGITSELVVVEWLTFTKELKNRLPEILNDFIDKTSEKNIIIVACRATIATLFQSFKKIPNAIFKEIDHSNEFHLIEIKK